MIKNFFVSFLTALALFVSIAPPAQAIVPADLVNRDDRYSVLVWTQTNVGRYIQPGRGTGTEQIARLSIPINMCYTYDINGLRRTACGNTVKTIYFGTYTQVVIRDAWVR